MKKLFYLLMLIPLCVYAENPPTVGDVTRCKHLAMGAPGKDAPGVTLIARRGYACLHSSYYKDPLWVSYLLTKDDLKTSVPRKDSFRRDPDLKKDFCSTPADYENSGFDQGHMAPCEDMTRDTETMKESFYLSNMVPQAPNNNRLFWNHLESRFRNYAKSYDNLYIITGPVFRKRLANGNRPVSTIGKNKVAVPVGIFKIGVRKLKNGRYTAIAVEVPNLRVMETSGFDKAMSRYLVSVDKIEKDTGMDFLNALSVAEQKRIESKKTKMWE